MSDDLQELRTRLAEIADLGRAAGVLGWDQRVTMPALGTPARADQLATLGRIAHERFTDPEVGRLLERLEPLEASLPYDSDDASLVRVTRRDWDKQRRVPVDLEEEMTRAAASGHHAWIEARKNRDFASFLPYLERNVELKRRYVECFDWSDSPYTPLLDDYEPGMLTSEVRDVFAVLRPALTELVARAPEIDASFLHGSFPVEGQQAFAANRHQAEEAALVWRRQDAPAGAAIVRAIQLAALGRDVQAVAHANDGGGSADVSGWATGPGCRR